MPEGIGYGGMATGPNAKAAVQKSPENAQAQRAEAQPPSGNQARQQSPGVDLQISQRAQQGNPAGAQQSDTYADPRGRGRS